MVILLLFFGSLLHPFHLSVTNVYYKEKEKVVQVEQRIFLDDFESAIRSFSGRSTFNITEDDPDEIDKWVAAYLEEHFTILVKGKEIELEYLGSEVELDANVMWCYFEAPRIKKFKSFEVRNSILLEIFSDQENIIHYKNPDGRTRSHKTDKDQDAVIFD